jgi:hypothetical protein
VHAPNAPTLTATSASTNGGERFAELDVLRDRADMDARLSREQLGAGTVNLFETFAI